MMIKGRVKKIALLIGSLVLLVALLFIFTHKKVNTYGKFQPITFYKDEYIKLFSDQILRAALRGISIRKYPNPEYYRVYKVERRSVSVEDLVKAFGLTKKTPYYYVSPEQDMSLTFNPKLNTFSLAGKGINRDRVRQAIFKDDSLNPEIVFPDLGEIQLFEESLGKAYRVTGVLVRYAVKDYALYKALSASQAYSYALNSELNWGGWVRFNFSCSREGCPSSSTVNVSSLPDNLQLLTLKLKYAPVIKEGEQYLVPVYLAELSGSKVYVNAIGEKVPATVRVYLFVVAAKIW